ncbi:MAG: hypothetical protein GXP22_00995 [Gammaproteobacteria bacterium]|nr:hypothetical protein [Gammaproteobacteria bacterium]
MGEKIDYQNISEVAYTDSKEKANAYLQLSWVMLNIESTQYSEHGWNTSFVFGWLKNNGEIKYPEKSKWEKNMEEEKEDESIPF